jgi:putative MATE family efflux protein
VIAVVANVANLGLDLLLVKGLDLGIAGSAWGTVVAQVGAAAVFLVITGRHARAAGASLRPRASGLRETAVVGSHLVLRTGSLLLALLAATAVAARISDAALAAHQITFQIWNFLALTLDAIAIAAQAMIGRFLGAGDAPGARAASRRMLELGVLTGAALGIAVALLRTVVVPVFSGAPAVQDLAEQALLVVAVLQPVAAVVFVLDGVLIGAGDSRYLALAMVAATLVYAPCALLVLALDGGLVALWLALGVWMVARLAGLGARYLDRRWLVTGASHRP